MEKNSTIKVAVLDGVAKGWTAKRTAIEHNLDLALVRRAASDMKVSFVWERIGVPPAYTKEPVSLSTLLKRHRHTIGESVTALQKAVDKMDKNSKSALEIAQVINFMRMRQVPKAWESRIRVTK